MIVRLSGVEAPCLLLSFSCTHTLIRKLGRNRITILPVCWPIHLSIAWLIIRPRFSGHIFVPLMWHFWQKSSFSPDLQSPGKYGHPWQNSCVCSCVLPQSLAVHLWQSWMHFACVSAILIVSFSTGIVPVVISGLMVYPSSVKIFRFCA